MFLALNTNMDWIIKTTVKLDAVLPTVDNLTNTIDAIDLSKEPKSTKGNESVQWQLISVKDNEWVELVEAIKIKIK